MPRGRFRVWTDQQLIDAVAASTSFTGICRALGLDPESGSHARVKRRVTMLGLDTSHFTNKDQRTGVEAWNQRRTELAASMLLAGSKVSRKFLRKFLIEYEIIPYRCWKCDNSGEHMGSPLALQLDHANGINNDDRIENLRWCCPNCHSQTDTFAGRNKRGQAMIYLLACRGCGELFETKRARAKFCSVRCTGTLRDVIAWPKPNVLALLVKAKGFTGAARVLGVSDNAVRKRLTRAVSLPAGGLPSKVLGGK
jgi:Zn finger protein HypA/HybF involved in hydrogenase expression